MAIFSSLETFLLSLLSLIIFSMFFITSKWVLFNFRTKKNLPPSPPKLPVIGNLHQLGSSPHRYLQSLSQKYGPLMLIQLGNVSTLVASSSEAAQEILKTHDLFFSNRPKLTMPNILLYGCKDIAFSSYGEYWRQLKSFVLIHLLSNTRVKSFRQVREEEVDLTIGVLGESHGSVVDMTALFASLSKNIICRVAFGKTHDGSKFTVLFRELTEVLFSFSVGNYISWLSWVDRISGLEGRAIKIAKEFDEFLEDILEEHINKRKMGNVISDEDKDLVDILLEVQSDSTTGGFTLERDSLKAVILDVFGAGIDNGSTTLEWAISELIKHPRVMKKLQQEVTGIAQGRSMIPEEDLEKLEYLKAVVKETLRLHVPLPLLVPHESTQDVKLMGYDIPARTQVLINAWAIATDSTLWEESMEFRPERFLNNSIDYKGLNFEFLPFGSGRRRCPGVQFSAFMIELALANIVYKFDLALPNGARNKDLDMSETYGITVRRKSSLLVIVSAR